MGYCVYCHKKYIGITCRKPSERWQNGNGYKNNQHFFRAIQKYGWHNFSHEILYTDLGKSEAEQLEIQIIREYHATDPDFGYNIENGGNGTDKFTDEIKQKISDALKGHVCTSETRQKISKAKKGRPSQKRGRMPPEFVEKNRLAHLGQTPWNKGRQWTADERAKCGGKAVRCIELNKMYRTAHEAGADLNIDFSSICKCVKGKAKTAGGYHWESLL